jgi:chemotaxis protein MotB
MKTSNTLIAFVLLVSLNSCVSKRFYLTEVSNWKIQLAEKQSLLEKKANDLSVTQDTLRDFRLKHTSEMSRYDKIVHTLNKAGDSLREQNLSLTVKNRESTVLVETLQKSYNARQNELQAAYAEQAVLKSIVEAQNNSWQSLEKPIREAFTDLGANSVQITREGGRLKLAIQDKLLFNSGSATINQQAQSSLLVLANAMANKPNISLMVEGHTDNVPLVGQTFKDNWELSTARARSVNQILSMKIDPQRLTIAGKGEFDPVAPNTSEDERAKNRRTEIYFDLKNSELEELLSDMAIDIQDTRAKVVTTPPNQEKYIIDERSWIRYELNSSPGGNKIALIRNLVQLNGKPWKVNTGNDYFQAKVRNYRVVVVKDNTPIIQAFDLVPDENRNILTIEIAGQ